MVVDDDGVCCHDDGRGGGDAWSRLVLHPFVFPSDPSSRVVVMIHDWYLVSTVAGGLAIVSKYEI